MEAGSMTVTVELVKRPAWQRVLRFPFVCRKHYLVFRRTDGRIVSLYGAWLMAGLTVKVG